MATRSTISIEGTKTIYTVNKNGKFFAEYDSYDSVMDAMDCLDINESHYELINNETGEVEDI